MTLSTNIDQADVNAPLVYPHQDISRVAGNRRNDRSQAVPLQMEMVVTIQDRTHVVTHGLPASVPFTVAMHPTVPPVSFAVQARLKSTAGPAATWPRQTSVGSETDSERPAYVHLLIAILEVCRLVVSHLGGRPLTSPKTIPSADTLSTLPRTEAREGDMRVGWYTKREDFVSDSEGVGKWHTCMLDGSPRIQTSLSKTPLKATQTALK